MKSSIGTMCIAAFIAFMQDEGTFVMWLAGVAFGAGLINAIRALREGRH